MVAQRQSAGVAGRKAKACGHGHGKKLVVKHLAVKPRKGEVGVIYTRTSSAGKKVRESRRRQLAASHRAAKALGVPIKSEISEICSGAAPWDRRGTFVGLLQGVTPGSGRKSSLDKPRILSSGAEMLPKSTPGAQGLKLSHKKASKSGAQVPKKLDAAQKAVEKSMTVFVESARAVARNSLIAECMWRESRDTGIQIVAADCPDLFKHLPSPTESFMRRIVCAQMEYDRDVTVQRLTAGLMSRKAQSEEVTQKGQVKFNGSYSILDRCQPKPGVLRRIKGAISQHVRGEFGLRPLAEKVGVILRKPISPMAVQRMMNEIKNKQL